MEALYAPPAGRPRHTDIPLATSEEELTRDYPFTGRIERFDPARGIWRFVEAKPTPTTLSRIERRMKPGQYRLITEDGDGIELEIEFEIETPDSATPTAAAAPPQAAPAVDPDAIRRLNADIDRLTRERDDYAADNKRLRDEMDARLARLRSDVDDAERRYTAAKREVVDARQAAYAETDARMEALNADVAALRASHAAAVTAAHAADVRRVRAEVEARSVGGLVEDDGEETDEASAAQASALETYSTLFERFSSNPLVQQAMSHFTGGAPASGDGAAHVPPAPATSAPVGDSGHGDAREAVAAPPPGDLAGPPPPSAPPPVADIVADLTSAASMALTAPNPTPDADAAWAHQVATYVRSQPPEAIQAPQLVRVLAGVAIEAAAKQVPVNRAGDVVHLIVRELGLGDQLRDYLAAGPKAILILLRPVLRRHGIDLPDGAEKVLTAVLRRLSTLLRT